MTPYHKIPTVFKRDPETNFKTLLEGNFATPELDYLSGNTWVWTEKVDGTNIRVIYDQDILTYMGRTDRADIPSHLVVGLDDLFTPVRHMFARDFADGACLYGEGYGARIQKGGSNYHPHASFVLFDVCIGGWWLKREDVHLIASKLGLIYVPPIDVGSLWQMVNYVRDGFQSWWGDFQAEGIVARPSTELQDRNGNRLITKIKCKDFPR